jgi:hypothetical protein
MLKSFHKFIGLSALAAFQIGIFDLTFNASASLAEDLEDRFDVCAGELNALGIPPEKTSAACADALHPEDLSVCVLSIKKNTEILAEDALESCYRVRRPVDLARCVVRINEQIVAQKVKPEETDTEEIPPQSPPPTDIQQSPPPTDNQQTPPPTDNQQTPPPQSPPPTENKLQTKEDIKLLAQTPPPQTPPAEEVETDEEIETQPTVDSDLVSLTLDSCRSSLLPLRFADCTIGLYQQIPNYPVQVAMTSCLSAEDNPTELLPPSEVSR